MASAELRRLPLVVVHNDGEHVQVRTLGSVERALR
jgi:hypothetical protein